MVKKGPRNCRNRALRNSDILWSVRICLCKMRCMWFQLKSLSPEGLKALRWDFGRKLPTRPRNNSSFEDLTDRHAMQDAVFSRHFKRIIQPWYFHQTFHPKCGYATFQPDAQRVNIACHQELDHFVFNVKLRACSEYAPRAYGSHLHYSFNTK